MGCDGRGTSSSPSVTLTGLRGAWSRVNPQNATHWSRASMSAQSQAVKSTVGRIWRDFSPTSRLTMVRLLVFDPLFVEKVVDVRRPARDTRRRRRWCCRG